MQPYAGCLVAWTLARADNGTIGSNLGQFAANPLKALEPKSFEAFCARFRPR